jgi:AcrR family transcriptional regulator
VSDRRTDLLDAAIEEIAIAGTRGMRVEAVARRARVSPALIYHHFGDRATLLASALERVGVRADAYTERAKPVRGSAHTRLVALLVAEVQDDPEVRINSAAWGELRDAAIFDPALRPVIADLTDRWVRDLAALVVEGRADGSISAPGSPNDLGVRLSAAVEGISSRWLAGMLTTVQARRHITAIVHDLAR